MKHLLLASAVVCLTSVAAFAADPKVDSAINTFGQVGNDPARLKTYCEMSAAQEGQGDKADDASEAALEPYITKLGADFDAAWDTNEETDDNSADGKRLAAALEQLEAKCDADDGGPDDGADDGKDDGGPDDGKDDGKDD